MELCNSILKFLAGLSSQKSSPLRIIKRQSHEAPPPDQVSNTMVGSEDDAQSSPETCRDVPESLQSSTHGSTRLPDMEVDHTAGPACPALNVGDYWISRHVKMITKVMISLRTWKLDLDEDEFRSVFNGTSSLREVTVKAAKQMLISIGENLVQSE